LTFAFGFTVMFSYIAASELVLFSRQRRVSA
jgi:hypothetical protein